MKIILENPNAQDKIITRLERTDKKKFFLRNEKDFKGFQSLKKVKFT
jgi:hypothetical protein